ncbi:MAG: hypothetical protein IPN95_10755 [Bacteroidetes bacterium]|nr:hypothetical protein [Bacteroidota bacterium]
MDSLILTWITYTLSCCRAMILAGSLLRQPSTRTWASRAMSARAMWPPRLPVAGGSGEVDFSGHGWGAAVAGGLFWWMVFNVL